jgi:hypothetical protein
MAVSLEPDGRTVVDFVGNLDAIDPISSSSDEEWESGSDRFDGDVRLVNVETGFVPYGGPSLGFTPESNLVHEVRVVETDRAQFQWPKMFLPSVQNIHNLPISSRPNRVAARAILDWREPWNS